jgi:hypothetical protein
LDLARSTVDGAHDRRAEVVLELDAVEGPVPGGYGFGGRLAR